MKLLYTIVGMLVVLFVITFSLTNIAPVRLTYYDVIDVKVPTYLLIFISFGVGVIFTGFLDIISRLGLKRTVSRLRKQIKVLEKNKGVLDTVHREAEVLPPESDEATNV